MGCAIRWCRLRPHASLAAVRDDLVVLVPRLEVALAQVILMAGGARYDDRASPRRGSPAPPCRRPCGWPRLARSPLPRRWRSASASLVAPGPIPRRRAARARKKIRTRVFIAGLHHHAPPPATCAAAASACSTAATMRPGAALLGASACCFAVDLLAAIDAAQA